MNRPERLAPWRNFSAMSNFAYSLEETLDDMFKKQADTNNRNLKEMCPAGVAEGLRLHKYFSVKNMWKAIEPNC
jgi:hypothetical protein